MRGRDHTPTAGAVAGHRAGLGAGQGAGQGASQGAVETPEGAPGADVRDAPTTRPVTRSAERFQGHVIAVRTDEVRMPDGATAARDVVVHPGAVGIIALDDAERVLLVQQYRHPVGRLLWEPPAGILDVAGEPSVVTAQRELYEEAHYRAQRWDVLVDAFTSPGMADEALRIFLARDLSPADGERHIGVHEEFEMPIAWLPLDEAVRKVLAGELHNPTAVMGILAAHAARGNGYAGLRPADAPWPERPVTAAPPTAHNRPPTACPPPVARQPRDRDFRMI